MFLFVVAGMYFCQYQQLNRILFSMVEDFRALCEGNECFKPFKRIKIQRLTVDVNV
jgi:hypothetical protein